MIAGSALLAGLGAGAYAILYGRRRRPRVHLTPERAQKTLDAYQGNVRRAAHQLGIAEKTLHLYLKAHPDIRRRAAKLRLAISRTGHGRPPYKHRYSHGEIVR